MSEHYDFHYQPTGSGAISGQQVLQQTEDAINELGDYVNDNVGGAMDVAQQALETAQNAEQDAQTALDTANSFSDAIQSAQQDASTALSTAQTAQTTATNANNTAIQAQQDASSAVTTANNASGQVSTLSGTVTALGQRVTTAEGNIGQNTSDITALTTRVGTAEGNITTLQNDVTIAQGNASSAMATAGQVKQQAFVFRYSTTALTPSSTNSNTLLDNTDNLKVGDKVIDSSGVLFSITAIDTQNSTFTIGTALIDLAQDSDVVHKSGNETISGTKTFEGVGINLKSRSAEYGVSGGDLSTIYSDKNSVQLAQIKLGNYTSGISYNKFSIFAYDSNNQLIDRTLTYSSSNNALTTAYFRPDSDNIVSLGTTGNRWSKVYATNYYYGSNNVEFSNKFVTTDTNQTISGNKTFSSNVNVYNSDSATDTANIILKNSKAERGSTTNIGEQNISFVDKDNAQIGNIKCDVDANGYSNLTLQCSDTNDTSSGVQVRKTATGITFQPTSNSQCYLGQSIRRWYNTYTSRINNLEPSSLSLPVFPSSSSSIDISSYITDMTGAVANSYTPPANGYITFVATGSQVQIFSDYGLQSKFSIQTGSTIRGYHPVLKNEAIKIYMIGTSIESFRFIPCQGNV